MFRLNEETIKKIKALEGCELSPIKSDDQNFEVTDKFLKKIEATVEFYKKNGPILADKKSQDSLINFSDFLKKNQDILHLEHLIARDAFFHYSDRHEYMQLPLDANEFADGCEGGGWLLDAIEAFTRNKSRGRPICHDTNEFRELLYFGLMQTYIEHTNVKATSTEHSIFWTLMDAVTADPKINLAVKDHKRYIRRAAELMKINGMFPDLFPAE